jgi:hypothetical protein
MLRHATQQLGHLFAYCWINQVWWPLPVVIMLLAIGVLVLSTQLATPYIYTLF